MIMIRARGNNILKTSNENISAFRMQPILCSIFLLQIFYWYFSSGLLWLALLLSLYKNFRVQGLINFGVVYIESDLILLFFFEPDRISNLLQETQTVLCYFIFNNFNDKGFFKKTSVYFRKLFYFLGNFELIFFSLSFWTNHFSTTTICYVTANTGVLNTACVRKKRSFLIEEHLDPDLEDIPDVSAASSDPPLDSSYEVDRDRDTDRQARCPLPSLYWIIIQISLFKGSRCIGGPPPWPTQAPRTRPPAPWPPSTAPPPSGHTTCAAENKTRYSNKTWQLK